VFEYFFGLYYGRIFLVLLGKTYQTNQVMTSTIDLELQEYWQDWIKVHVRR
jgi:hypothetical protein